MSKHEAIKSSKRKAPHIESWNGPPPARAKRRINGGRQGGTINHEVRVTNRSLPNATIHQRLLRRIADAEAARHQRRSEQCGKRDAEREGENTMREVKPKHQVAQGSKRSGDDVVKDDVHPKVFKLEVEGSWKLEDEQLKACWACRPLPTTAHATERVSGKKAIEVNGKDRKKKGDQTEEDDGRLNGTKGDANQTRKNFVHCRLVLPHETLSRKCNIYRSFVVWA